MSRPVWKDATSYSRDGDKTPRSWSLRISSDVAITVVSRHIYYPDQWVMHCRPWFDTFSLDLAGSPENAEEAQARAVALVREKITELASQFREIN